MKKLISKVTSIMKNLLKLNIKQKLMLSNIIIIAIPMIILQFNSFNKVKLMTEKEYLSNITLEVSKLKSDIMKNVEQYIKASQFILNNQDFIDFVSTYQERTANDVFVFKTNVLDQIEYLQYINFNINRVRFFTDNPYIPESWPILYQLERIANQKYIADFINDSRKVTLWKINNVDFLGPPLNSDAKVVSFYTKVMDPLGHMIGIIEVNMLTDEFFANELSRSSKNSFLIALTGDGQIIFHQDFTKFLAKFGFNIVDFEKELKNKTTKREGILNIKKDKNLATAVYTYIPNLDMTIYKIVSFDNLNKEINNLTKRMFEQVFVLIVLSSVSISLIITLIFKKLKKIISSMRKVERGEFEVDFEVHGNDEIDELAYHFKRMVERLKILIADIVKKELSQKDAQIKALQSQINAHFIYNVLENIKMIAECFEDYEVSNAITKLGKMMRYNMSWKREKVTLKEELENIQNYISLMNLRFDNEIRLLINVDEDILKFEIPKLILQPIVENAITYGIEPKGEGGSIFIDANVINDFLVISIIDDGKGIELQRLEQIQRAIERGEEVEFCQGQGIALKNVNERIKLTYGKSYGLKIESKEGQFTKVTITLPYCKEGVDTAAVNPNK